MKKYIFCVFIAILMTLIPFQSKAAESGHRIIFLGDSRTVGMEIATKNIASNDDVLFIASVGAGLSWGKAACNESIDPIVQPGDSIVITLGANDCMSEKMYQSYCSYFNDKAIMWSELGADVCYVSVNPVGSYQYATVTMDDVLLWNRNMQNNLNDTIEYIDICSQIEDSIHYADYLHYMSDTNLDIYNLIMDHLHNKEKHAEHKNILTQQYREYTDSLSTIENEIALRVMPVELFSIQIGEKMHRNYASTKTKWSHLSARPFKHSTVYLEEF